MIAANSYRRNIMRAGAGFNHPRTMSAKVWAEIPEDHYRFHTGRRKGQPYDYGADYVFMVPGLELAGPRHRYLRDPLLAYNHANPEADYLVSGPDTAAVLTDLLSRPGLGPLEARRPDGRLLYLPDPERHAVIAGYAQRHGLRHLVETGTYRGDTVAALVSMFDTVDTVEMEPKLYKAARMRFRDDRRVRCHHGDSRKALPSILANLKGPALFWLDGHTSGPETARSDCPLRAELMMVLADRRRHVILIDDARCLHGQPSHHEWMHYADYPSLEWIAAQAAVAGYSCELADDIVRLEP